MATVTLLAAFDTDDIWAPLFGAAITKSATTYEFQNTSGFFVRVSGTGLTYTGELPATGTYTSVTVYSDILFTTAVAISTFAPGVDFATFFDAGLPALDGDDTLSGSGGSDALAGGTGDDAYFIGAGDTVTEAADAGTDTVVSSTISINLASFANVENVQLNGATPLSATGNEFANVLFGETNSAANVLTGGAGNDGYVLGAGDTVVESAGGGTDTAYSSTISLNLSSYANVENGELFGSATGLNLIGTAGANSLSGERNTQANVLTGLGGNDAYIVGAGDSVVETASGGIDTAVSSTVSIDLTFAAFANVENVQLNGATALSAKGNNSANTLYGGTNSAANVLTGRGGNDIYVVGAGDSVVEIAGGGIDTASSSTVSIDLAAAKFAHVENAELTGTAALAALGSNSANTLRGDGNSAANVLTGRGGNDTYIVGAGDRAVETSRGGIDLALSFTVSIDLASSAFANVENVQLSGGAALSALGSKGANTLHGETNSAANVLTGRGGNDTYVVGVGDRVVEAKKGGTDIVVSSAVSIDLATSKFANVENVQLEGTKALRAAGSNVANALHGETSSAANVLTGRGGNDNYYVGARDKIVETASGGKEDVVISQVLSLDLRSALYANVENAVVLGTKKLNVTGDDGSNELYGNAAANVLKGLKGADFLTGQGGHDVFVFDTLASSGTTNQTRDVITDFIHLRDDIDLAGIDANSKAGGDQRFTFLATKGAAFTHKAGELHYLKAGANTLIEGDVNGDGKGDFQILLLGTKTLTGADFIL